ESFARTIMMDDSSGHDYEHVKRVRLMAERILLHEKADSFIVVLAALLHDVDDKKLGGPGDRAERFLREQRVAEPIRTAVLGILLTMSYSAQTAGAVTPSIEGMIVQDADRLDAIGAIGVARAFAYGGKKGRPIYAGAADDDSSLAHFHQKLLKLKDLMNTKTAKRIAARRHRFLLGYLKQFMKEWDGK
ncbi:MAG: HD domain-containing protein, partial [Bacillota bacterium]|nr:HD domain-containing protein [Bacillota bacterium]